MRSTIHLVTADDCTVLRPFAQPGDRPRAARPSRCRTRLAGVDLVPVLAFAHEAMTEQPRSPTALRARSWASGFPTSIPAPWPPRAETTCLWCRYRPAGVGAVGRSHVRARRHLPGTARSPTRRRSTRSCCATSRRSVPHRRRDLAAWSGLTGSARAGSIASSRSCASSATNAASSSSTCPTHRVREADVPAPPPVPPRVRQPAPEPRRPQPVPPRRRRTATRRGHTRGARRAVLNDGAGVGTWRTEPRDDGSITARRRSPRRALEARSTCDCGPRGACDARVPAARCRARRRSPSRAWTDPPSRTTRQRVNECVGSPRWRSAMIVRRISFVPP
jgi:hypothetical protein